MTIHFLETPEVARSDLCLWAVIHVLTFWRFGNIVPLRYHLTAQRGLRSPGAESRYLEDWVSGGKEVRGGRYGFVRGLDVGPWIHSPTALWGTFVSVLLCRKRNVRPPSLSRPNFLTYYQASPTGPEGVCERENLTVQDVCWCFSSPCSSCFSQMRQKNVSNACDERLLTAR